MRFFLRFHLEHLFIAFLRIKQLLRLLRRQFPGFTHRLGRWLVSFLAFFFLGGGTLLIFLFLLLLLLFFLVLLVLGLLILRLLVLLIRFRRLLLVLLLLILLLLLLVLLLLLFEQLFQFLQFHVAGIGFQTAFHPLQSGWHVVGDIKLGPAVEKIIRGRPLGERLGPDQQQAKADEDSQYHRYSSVFL